MKTISMLSTACACVLAGGIARAQPPASEREALAPVEAETAVGQIIARDGDTVFSNRTWVLFGRDDDDDHDDRRDDDRWDDDDDWDDDGWDDDDDDWDDDDDDDRDDDDDDDDDD